MSSPEAIAEQADRLAGYAATCRMENNLQWMEGLAVRINEYLKARNSNERVQTSGYSLDVFMTERK